MIQTFKIIEFILKILITVLAVILILSSFSKENIKKFNVKTKNALNKKLKDDKFLSYERIERYLKSTGAVFMLKLEPSSYIFIKLGLSILFLTVGISFKSILISIILMVLGFFSLDMILNLSNKEDNDKILIDLKNVYDTLRIQTKSGVYFTNSLTECYLVAKNKRLKTALLELNNKIIAENDIEGAIEEFNGKFKNSYIDTFCIVIKQSLSSGKTVQVLNDLSEQIRDIQDSLDLKDEKAVESKIQRLQFFIYLGAIAMVVFGIFNELSSSILNF